MGGCTSAPADQPPPLPAMPSKTASNAGSGGAASKGKPAHAQNGRASTSDNEWDNVKTRPKSMSQDEIDIRLVESYESTWNLGASLSQIPILANLTDEQRTLLSNVMREVTFKDREAIVKEGELGRDFFIIREGEAAVTKLKADHKEEVQIAQLKKGDYFGEKALLTNEPRGATVRAKGKCVCLTLDREQFVKLFGATFNIQFAKRQGISAESGAHVQVYVVPANAVRKKTNEQRARIFKALKSNVIFGHIDDEQHKRIVDEMWLKDIAAGTSIIKQGEPGDNFYVVELGEFEIFVSKNKKKARKVATIQSGSSFGELALMYNAPRAATVTASQDSTVWAIDRFSFRRILTNVSENKLREYTTFLQGVPLFSPLASYERVKIAEALEEVHFEAGQKIIKQGEPGDSFFILRAGEVVITRHEVDTPTVEAELQKCLPGDFFGERALLTNEPRAASVTARTKAVCLTLDRHAFQLLLGPLEEILHKRVASYSSMSNLVSTHSMDSTVEAAVSEPAIDLKNLKTIGTLGKGSFGHVQLMKDGSTDKTYALKTVSKMHVVQMGQQEHTASERQVMIMLNHPNIIRLYLTYQDKKCIYFLMEPCLGGELFSVLRARASFDEDTARFYAASVVLAFEYMHSKDIVYRDLKPENLLLDSKGYLKVTDFGFAKILNNDRTWTLCGTPDYLAPEVVSGQGHGKGVDWWTLGVLIYEMLASYPPFYDDDPMNTYAKILQCNIVYPKSFSKDAVSLVGGLLNPKSTKRLGVVKGGAKLIKEHPWFSNFDWDGLRKRLIKAPIIPKIKNDLDLSNFEKYPEDNSVFADYVEDGNNYFKDF